jgi:hypothetical protein
MPGGRAAYSFGQKDTGVLAIFTKNAIQHAGERGYFMHAVRQQTWYKDSG